MCWTLERTIPPRCRALEATLGQREVLQFATCSGVGSAGRTSAEHSAPFQQCRLSGSPPGCVIRPRKSPVQHGSPGAPHRKQSPPPHLPGTSPRLHQSHCHRCMRWSIRSWDVPPLPATCSPTVLKCCTGVACENVGCTVNENVE